MNNFSSSCIERFTLIVIDALIKIDPYYQAIYGDNSLFDSKRKEFVLEAIREYSQKNPYFINFSQHVDLEGFYDKDLDKILMLEYDKAIGLNNHYVYFLNYIITQGVDVSKDIQEFIQDKIKSNIPFHYKIDLLRFFESIGDTTFLREVLDAIVARKISDEENSLKDLILGVLYPNYITPQEILEYLICYEKNDVLYLHYSYLFMTPFEKKTKLIDEILQNRNKLKNGQNSFLPYSIFDFVKDFFFEIYIKLDNIQNIYTCLKYFQDKYFQYNKIEISPLTKENREVETTNQKKLQEISNDLFKERVRDQVKQNNILMYDVYNFPYYCSPTNTTNVFFSILNEIKNGELLGDIEEEGKRNTKKNIFLAWLKSLPLEKRNKEYCIQVAQENSLDKEYEEYEEYLAKENQRHNEIEKSEEEQKQKIKISLDKNEDFFREKDIKELINDFNVMNWIAELFLYQQNDISKYITAETFENKLKIALKEILYIHPHPFSNVELTIDELSKQPQNSIRNIDAVYYASICVNDEELKHEALDADFKSYLYIVSLWYENMHNVQDVGFCEVLENNDTDFVHDTLKEYISLLTERCFDDKEIIATILKNFQNETKLESLKLFAKLHENDDNLPMRFIYEILKLYGFSLKLEELNALNKACIGEKNRETISALQSLHNNALPDIETALSIFFLLDVFPGYEENFLILDNSLKIKILTYLMKAFNTKELLKEKRSASAMSTRDLCVWFLKYDALARIDEDDLQTLLNSFQNTTWEYKILHAINENREKIKQNDNLIYKIDEIKKMIIQDAVVNEKMFFELIYHRLQDLGEKIHVNEDNDKSTYYNTIGKKHEWTSKKEEEIRDILFHILKTCYEGDSIWIKEKHEASNRVDMHVKYYRHRNFKVQIECKKDTNTELISGIKDQLIDKYLRAEDSFGIYLVFYFGEAKYSKEEILILLNSELEKNKNSKYRERIKILMIDFSLA